MATTFSTNPSDEPEAAAPDDAATSSFSAASGAAVALSSAVAAAITAVVIWKDCLSIPTFNNWESANYDAFSQLLSIF